MVYVLWILAELENLLQNYARCTWHIIELGKRYTITYRLITYVEYFLYKNVQKTVTYQTHEVVTQMRRPISRPAISLPVQNNHSSN